MTSILGDREVSDKFLRTFARSRRSKYWTGRRRPIARPPRTVRIISPFRLLFILFNLAVEANKANRPMRTVTKEIPGTFLIAVDLNYDVRFKSGSPLPTGRLFPILPL